MDLPGDVDTLATAVIDSAALAQMLTHTCLRSAAIGGWNFDRPLVNISPHHQVQLISADYMDVRRSMGKNPQKQALLVQSLMMAHVEQ